MTNQIANMTMPASDRDPDRTLAILNRDGTPGLELDPHQIMLFANKSKDAENLGRPDYYGFYNPGSSEKLQRLAIWSQLDRNGNAKLTGYVEEYDPERALAANDERPVEHAAPPRAAETENKPDPAPYSPPSHQLPPASQ